jgi:copper chaperone NosL
MLRKIKKYPFLLLMVILISSCSNQKPRNINIGEDICAYCKMGITDNRFSSELITSKGKVYKFDAIECLAAFYNNSDRTIKDNAKLWVHDFMKPDKWLSVNTAIFMRSEKIRSPMALNLLAVGSDSERVRIQQQFDGDQIRWKDLLIYVNKNMK